MPTPRPNENGGTYGNGLIAKQYSPGSTIDVLIHLTTAHKGDFKFGLCNLDQSAETENCFQTVSK